MDTAQESLLTLSTVLMTGQLKTLSPELGRLNIIKSKQFEGGYYITGRLAGLG